VDEQAELLPYDKKWEFPRDKLKLGEFQYFIPVVAIHQEQNN
jgi:FMS-like tyrosine kinase 1